MHPISKLLCDAYNELFKNGQVKFPLHEKQRVAIDSVVKTVHANYFGIERFPTEIDKAIAYLCLIIKDHPVIDGNKRLAIFWFTIYCIVNDLQPNTTTIGLDALAVSIEREKEQPLYEMMAVVRQVLFPDQ